MIEAIEFSTLGQAARSSVWLYPFANLAHVLGATLLVGAILVFDILVLRGHYVLAAAVAPIALTVAGLGVAIQIVTGPVLFSAEATALARNPAFIVKMALIVVALLNVAMFHFGKRRGPSGGFPAQAGLHAAVSAVVWIVVVLAGRAIAYI